MEEAATPFPSEETTPPVTKIYFGAILIARVALPGLYALHRIDVHRIMAATRVPVKSKTLFPRNDFSSLARREPFFLSSGLCLPQKAGVRDGAFQPRIEHILRLPRNQHCGGSRLIMERLRTHEDSRATFLTRQCSYD